MHLQRPEKDFQCLPLSCSTYFLGTVTLAEPGAYSFPVTLAASELQRVSYLPCLPSPGTPGVNGHTPLFVIKWVTGLHTQVLVFLQQVLLLSEPSPQPPVCPALPGMPASDAWLSAQECKLTLSGIKLQLP